jgi:polyferredoxin
VAFLKRRIFQGLGTLLPNTYIQGFLAPSLYQGTLKGVCTPLFNCYACPSALFSCPIGSMQHFAATGKVPFYAAGTMAVVGASVGRMTCGTLCPFGFLQDLLFKVRTWKGRLPGWASYLRYAALAVLVFLVPALTQVPWFSRLCPLGTVSAGLPWVTLSESVLALVGSIFWVKIGILLIFVTSSVLAKRPFCRAACPLGAIFSLFNRSSFLQLAWNPDTCTRCGKCQMICPVDIRPDYKPDSAECLRCLDCTRCPSLKLTTVLNRNPFGIPGREADNRAENLSGVPAG